MRRGVPNRIPEFDRRWCQDRRVFGEGVQRKALALGPGLPFAGAVRELLGDAIGSEDLGMKIPHRGGGSVRSQVPQPGSAPGKGSGLEFHGLLTDLALQFGYPAFFAALLAHAAERALAVLLQLAPPAVQFTGIHLQRTRDLSDALSALQPANGRLFEFLREISARLHLASFPFR